MLLSLYNVLFDLYYVCISFSFFFFNDTATTEIYTLSLHDALPISKGLKLTESRKLSALNFADEIEKLIHQIGIENGTVEIVIHPSEPSFYGMNTVDRSEEHTSELQSPCNLVCRLLLEKKKKKKEKKEKKKQITTSHNT